MNKLHDRITQEDHRRFERIIRGVQELRFTSPKEAHRLEIEICCKVFDELTEPQSSANRDEELRIGLTKENLRQVLIGKRTLESIVALGQEAASLPIWNQSCRIH
jgi:hypothetical protein